MTPLKILFIGWADHVHLVRWVEYFVRRGHRVWVLSDREGKIPGARILRSRTKRFRTSLQALELMLYHRILGIDVVHAHWASFGYIPAIAGIHPYVVTGWGSDIYRYDRYDEKSKCMVKTSLSSADLITVDSQDLMVEVKKITGDTSRVEIIQWGVDTRIFRPVSKMEKSALREKLGIGAKNVIYSARSLGKVYNVDIILKAYREVLAKQPDCVMIQKHYNASDEDIRAFWDTVDSLGIRDKILFVGEIDYGDLPAYYNAADIVVSVPSSDGTPMSMLEAMACETPLIVSDLPSLREWIRDGENGFIVPIRDAGRLAGRILSVFENLGAIRFLSANREMVSKTADHEMNMSRMESFYQSIAGKKTRSGAGRDV